MGLEVPVGNEVGLEIHEGVEVGLVIAVVECVGQLNLRYIGHMICVCSYIGKT